MVISFRIWEIANLLYAQSCRGWTLGSDDPHRNHFCSFPVVSFWKLMMARWWQSFRTLILYFTFSGKIFITNRRVKSPDWILLSPSLLLFLLLDQLLWPGRCGGGELFYNVSQSGPTIPAPQLRMKSNSGMQPRLRICRNSFWKVI